MKKIKKKLTKKKLTIALLYHYVSKEIVDEYFSKEHALVDNQTDDIVQYMHKLFLKKGYKVQIIKVKPDDLSELKKLKADFVFNLVDSKKMEMEIAKILARLHIPYSGSTFEGIRISNNKLKTNASEQIVRSEMCGKCFVGCKRAKTLKNFPSAAAA